ncbi:hypothetical protein WR25_04403 [Diploscapter pachys]|uniref:Uncharacterized protein n=1 Tax=Diploscapter pachys TaxID=2018661 RepID=A0A2A2J8K4_9BILA|nr:hypothetical protein WR25_04403 [Diploscapter pachys]
MVAEEHKKGNPPLQLFLKNLEEECHNTDFVSIIAKTNDKLRENYRELSTDTLKMITLLSLEYAPRKLPLYLPTSFGKDESKQEKKKAEEASKEREMQGQMVDEAKKLSLWNNITAMVSGLFTRQVALQDVYNFKSDNINIQVLIGNGEQKQETKQSILSEVRELRMQNAALTANI